MDIQRLRHVALMVRSLDRMLPFYRDTLGFTVKKDVKIGGAEFQAGTGLAGAAARCVHLSISGSPVELELFEFDPPHNEIEPTIPGINDKGFRHIAFVVKNMKQAVAKLKTAGIIFHTEPVRFSSPEHSKGVCFVYLRDPEGNIIELNEIPEGAS